MIYFSKLFPKKKILLKKKSLMSETFLVITWDVNIYSSGYCTLCWKKKKKQHTKKRPVNQSLPVAVQTQFSTGQQAL